MVSQRFSYVRYDEVRAAKQGYFKGLFEAIEENVMTGLPDGRPQSLCLTALEEAYMWVGKAIRDEQIAVDGAVKEEAHRGEEGVNVEPKPAKDPQDDIRAFKAAMEDKAVAAAGGYKLHVVRKSPGHIDGHGLELLAVSVVPLLSTNPLRTFHVFSGAPGRQTFQKGGPANVPGSLMPCPQGSYSLGSEEWAQGKDNFDASHGPGLGPCFIPFEPLSSTRRGSFGIHLDENHATSPGSAGCLVFETAASFKEFLAAFRQYKPTTMTVDWGV